MITGFSHDVIIPGQSFPLQRISALSIFATSSGHGVVLDDADDRPGSLVRKLANQGAWISSIQVHQTPGDHIGTFYGHILLGKAILNPFARKNRVFFSSGWPRISDLNSAFESSEVCRHEAGKFEAWCSHSSNKLKPCIEFTLTSKAIA